MERVADGTGGFPAHIAARIKLADRDLSSRWLRELKDLLPVGVNEIFPSDHILDHIPSLIREIADYVAASVPDAIAANTGIQSKAHELGVLRFEQQASVHQLLREYRILGSVIAQFVHDEAKTLPAGTPPSEAVLALSRLSDAVFVLLQMTVDTFVGKYTERIDSQTARLEGFNRMVTHELRQPLHNAQMAIDLLTQHPGADAATIAQYLDLGRRNITRLGDLIRILGTLARPDHDSPQTQVVDLSQVVAEAIRQMQDVAASKRVALRSDVPSTEVEVDVSRLELILVNLLSNGIKYRDPAKAGCFVEVAAARLDTGLRIEVRDNGLGIDPADCGQVFKRFVRAHADRDDALGNDGLGLGLSIVSECVKALRGSIQVESTPGAGSVFIVTLPLGEG
jgi:signal transduction histidine kinase